MKSTAKLAGLVMLVSGYSATAMAADGTVNFKGDIVDTPCVVATESDGQTVKLNQVKASSFKAKADTSTAQSFTIKLEECTTDTLKNANVTFTGQADSNDDTLLSLASGANIATGVGIEIMNNDNTVIPINGTSADSVLVDGDNTLYFKAHYKSTAATVTAGPANSQADFQVSYK